MTGISRNEKSEVAKYISKLDDKIDLNRVLDVGVGFGVWNHLLRRDKQFWVALTDDKANVDLFNLNLIYDRVFIADAHIVDYDKIGSWFDLAIIHDVLDLIPKEEAKDIITDLLPRAHHLMIAIQTNPDDARYWTTTEMTDFLVEFPGTHKVVQTLIGDSETYYIVETL